jgi:hypothetical protein
MATIVIEFLQLVEQECGGMRRHMFNDAMDGGQQRFGQAFMNALRGSPYYDLLSGTPYDCFYAADDMVYEAIDWLTRKK